MVASLDGWAIIWAIITTIVKCTDDQSDAKNSSEVLEPRSLLMQITCFPQIIGSTTSPLGSFQRHCVKYGWPELLWVAEKMVGW